MRRRPVPPGHFEIVDRIREEREGLRAAGGFRIVRRDDLRQAVAAVIELALEAPRTLLQADPGADIEALVVPVAVGGGAAILEMRHRIDRAEMRPARLPARIQPL